VRTYVTLDLNGELTYFLGGQYSSAPVWTSSAMTRTLVDQRHCWQLTPTLVAGGQMIYGGVLATRSLMNFLDGNEGPWLEPARFALQPVAAVIQASLRLLNAVDVPTARLFFGWSNNGAASDTSALGATRLVPRVGIMGDGLTGLRFGSVNCPDGAAAGQNGFTDIDPGFVQPGALVNPGTGWFQVRVKLIPFTATNPAQIACYLNGRLVVVFTGPSTTNMPRGRGNVNRHYQVLQPMLLADFDAVTQLAGWLMTEFELWYDTDLSL